MKRGTVFMLAGVVLIAAALGLTGYNLLDAHRAGKEAGTVLEQLTPQIDPDPVPAEGRETAQSGSAAHRTDGGEVEYPDYVLDPTRDMPVKTVDGDAYIGVVSIPSLDRELPVFAEWGYPHLKKAPCRYVGSAYLDNMVICAHNYDRHFGTIKYLNYGDTVTFTDMDGNRFIYKVLEIETLNPYDSEHMVSGDWDLTLFTCTIGGRTRVTVRCERVSPEKRDKSPLGE